MEESVNIFDLADVARMSSAALGVELVAVAAARLALDRDRPYLEAVARHAADLEFSLRLWQTVVEEAGRRLHLAK